MMENAGLPGCLWLNLDKTHGPKAKAMLTLLHSKGVIHFLLFLQDVLSTLSRLSQEIQRKESSIYLIHAQLRTCICSLGKLEQRPGQMLADCFSTDYYEGEKLVGAFTYPTEVIKKLTTCTENRFSDLEDNLLKSTKIADLTSWPLEFDGDFGDVAVRTIISHFQDIFTLQGCDVGQIMSEWDHLKQLLYENEKIFEVTWEDINKKYKAKCPNVLDLMDLILTLPASSAECERGFSVMKITKTYYRNRLSSKNLSMLMAIKLHSSEIEDFDPGPAIHYWNSRAIRRLHGKQTTVSTALAQSQSQITDLELEEGEQQLQEPSAADPAVAESTHDDGFDSDFDSDFEEFSDLELSDFDENE